MIKEFNRICDFRRDHPGVRGSGLSVNDPILTGVKRDLESLKNQLEGKFNHFKGLIWEIKQSVGNTNFPSILHICILPPYQKVSDGIYAVICFDKLGRGALVGCIESVSNSKGLKTKIRKVRGKELRIDVDGLRPTTKYNNAFANPKEFFVNQISEKELLAHIEQSMEMALYNFGQTLDKNLPIGIRVDSDKFVPPFQPDNLSDAREKIAAEIAVRRGSKKFRKAILKAYNSACAVTGCKFEGVLEAAHIIPYKGEHTDHVQNGILLRSDIHLLFDLGLLSIDHETKKILIKDDLEETNYFEYKNQKISLPKNISDHPHNDSLKWHNENEFYKT